MAMSQPPSSRMSLRASSARAALSACARALTDLLVPPVCLACRTPLASHDALCGACWRGIDFIRPPLCDRLGIPLPYDTGLPTVSAAALANPPAFDRARAVARFEGAMRRLVHDLKYADRHEGLPLFGRWLAGAARELLPGTDMIVPVPLYRWRLWRRRYNQAALLAQALGRETGLAVDPLLLVRARPTTSQVGLTPDQRRRNVEGAFAVPDQRHEVIAGRRILLVDDVVTTGATAEACARVLRRSGAARIDVVTLALVTEVHAVAL